MPVKKLCTKKQWAGLDSNQRKLTLTGLQPVPSKSQPAEKQTFTTPRKCSVQTSVQTKTENARNQAKDLPADLAEIVAVWPKLPEHIKAAIKALVQTHTEST
ncbi:MAG: hypothetical protein ACW99G_02175 [Candidatus Thorarchaeota archaeon]